MTQDELLAGLVIPIDKPRKWTSFQAVNKVKATIRNTYGLKKFKIGHAGTLDPLATGLLLVCVGKATKRIDELQAGEKVYTGTMVLGATTPCYDLERPIDQYYPWEHITPQLIKQTIPQFMGNIEQVPPIFSAVKIGGQRAYSYAREALNGEEVPSPTPKEIHIEEFEITAFRPGMAVTNPQPIQTEEVNGTHLYDNPLGIVPEHLPQIDFRIRCGKGTYIRSIARDLGLALDSGAFLSALRREQVGEYTVQEAVSLEEINTFLAGNAV
ncbi:MAG: tRNA pseudouridine(55) synthase TruB [Bacteroidales bacterium]|nr:tRNA pseudouridine(55) synthase TruB [Bacteroidales bacterium]